MIARGPRDNGIFPQTTANIPYKVLSQSIPQLFLCLRFPLMHLPGH